MSQDDTVSLNKTMLHFQFLPLSKVDPFLLCIHQVRPLNRPNSLMIPWI